MKRYSLYGLTIASEIPLHAPAGANGPVDLTVTQGAPRPVPSAPAEGEVLCEVRHGSGGAAHVRTAHGYSLRYYGTAEFQFDAALSRVMAHTDPNASVDLVPEFLTASVPAFKLLLSGRMVLHASAVARDGAAIALLAQSGGGKSTLAAALCSNGFSPVTDDVVVLEWRSDGPWVMPGTGELRLRDGSAALPLLSAGAARRQTQDRRSAVQLGSAQPARLAGMVSVGVVDAAAPRAMLDRLDAAASLAAILGHLRVAGWKDTPVLQALFPEQARLVREVPCWSLTIPSGVIGLQAATQLLAAIPADARE